MPTEEPKRVRVLRAVQTALAAIHQSDGYFTDGGDHVVLGEITVSAVEDLQAVLPALSVTVGRVEPPAQGRQVQVKLPIIVAGLVLEDDDDPMITAELMVADVKRALFGPAADPTFGGLVSEFTQVATQPVPREKGSQVMGLQLEVEANFVETREGM